MKKIKLPIAIAVFVLFIIIVNSFEYIFYHKTNSEIDTINLKLTGKIDKIKEMKYGHDYGYCSISIEDSNIQYYDYRELKKEFFLIIKNGKCLILSPKTSELKIGDKVTIDKGKFSSFKDNNLTTEFYLTSLPHALMDSYDSLIK